MSRRIHRLWGNKLEPLLYGGGPGDPDNEGPGQAGSGSSGGGSSHGGGGDPDRQDRARETREAERSTSTSTSGGDPDRQDRARETREQERTNVAGKTSDSWTKAYQDYSPIPERGRAADAWGPKQSADTIGYDAAGFPTGSQGSWERENPGLATLENIVRTVAPALVPGGAILKYMGLFDKPDPYGPRATPGGPAHEGGDPDRHIPASSGSGTADVSSQSTGALLQNMKDVGLMQYFHKLSQESNNLFRLRNESKRSDFFTAEQNDIFTELKNKHMGRSGINTLTPSFLQYEPLIRGRRLQLQSIEETADNDSPLIGTR